MKMDDLGVPLFSETSTYYMAKPRDIRMQQATFRFDL